ncbi:ChbG/HpnK family deacetylase [Bradyrhizobium prioriisuperbiae]|uniref:ChbG/HpnK family deacetylase n=1 Tax=Bradyrhizobium prioriisuperbiae TaxID=2854389 RepID=UPI0028E4E3D8|nr:ChbG/HpnK family deacetylase [Bradyrhizobium prioritasuperba]
MNPALPPRRIWLCADDYGLSPGINRGIRDLIERRRLNATSVMVVGPAIRRDEVEALKTAVATGPCAIGLHTTLTAPFHPLTMYFRPLHGGVFLPLGAMLRTSLLRRLDPEIVRGEIAAQLSAFAELFGRPPDYVDGHQHVQLFPQVRDAFLAAVKKAAPNAWVRQCGRTLPLSQKLQNPKALLLDVLSARFRVRCQQAGLAYNPGFAGAYDFTQSVDFGKVMPAFFEGLPDNGLVMCHPGFVDDVLIGLDPLTDQREREYAFIAGDDFPRLLAANVITLREPAP